MDTLVRAEAAYAGLRLDDVRTNQRVNLGDGGTDTEVAKPLDGSLQLESASAWQYKATDLTDIGPADLMAEVKKPRAHSRLAAGDTYCLCVCDETTVEKQEDRLAALTAAVAQVAPDAPKPRLLLAGALADWANRFPSVVVAFFRPQYAPAMAYEAWFRKERADLPSYVELSVREKAVEQIRAHVDFRRASTPTIIVRGPSGAGKSRCVAEALGPVGPLVLYIRDTSSVAEVVTHLVNDERATAVLVVDACSGSTRRLVSDQLRGIESRVRAVIIADAAEPVYSNAVVVDVLNEVDVQRVLAENFPKVSASHRRAVGHFSDGVLQVAAWMARSYRANPSGFVQDARRDAADELQPLLPNDQDKRTLQALSLFLRVGHDGDVAGELVTICTAFGLDAHAVAERCGQLAAAPGVVAVGPRYIVVRPRLFVAPLLSAAWSNAIRRDLPGFLAQFSPVMQLAFIQQVATHGDDDQRNQVIDWAQTWLSGLSPEDLTEAAAVRLLLALVDVMPVRVLPKLAELTGAATGDVLRCDGERMSGGWYTRLHILWCLRDHLGSRSTFRMAERALFKIALEGEDNKPGFSEDSTAAGIWASSFKVFLSGTEVVFSDRIGLLRKRLDDEDPRAGALVLGAVRRILSVQATFSEGNPVVAGKARPRHWQPRDREELLACLRAAMEVLTTCATRAELRDEAMQVGVTHGRALLQVGLLRELRLFHTKFVPTEDGNAAILLLVRDFLRWDTTSSDGTPTHDPAYVTEVTDWLHTLERSDAGGQLVDLVMATHWFVEDENKSKKVAAVATALYADHEELLRRIPWLLSNHHNGHAIFELGEQLAHLDPSGGLLAPLFSAAPEATNPLLLRGYLEAHAKTGRLDLAPYVKALETTRPPLAVDLAAFLSGTSPRVEVALRLVRQGTLSIDTLPYSLHGLNDEQLVEVLTLTFDSLMADPSKAAAVAFGLVQGIAWNTGMDLYSQQLERLLWTLLEMAAPDTGQNCHSWGQLLRRLAPADVGRAVRLAGAALSGSDFVTCEEATKVLSALAAFAPDACFRELKPLFTASRPGALRLRGGAQVLAAFPERILKAWLTEDGLAAARHVAAALPRPYLGADGMPIVPPLTEFVLERYGEDATVAENFAEGPYSARLEHSIVDRREKEADVAAAFVGHEVPAVHRWAEAERASALHDARRWRQLEENDYADE